MHAHLIRAFEVFAVLAVAAHTHTRAVSENTVASTTESSNDRDESVDDRSFIFLTETKFSFRCIPVWDRYSPHRTRVEKKKTHVIMLSP